MLSFDIRALEEHAVSVDDVLLPDDPVWQQDDPRPAEPIRVTGRLSAAGPGRFYWHGRIEGEISMPCRRCLADAGASVSGDEHAIFVDDDDDEADNPDVFTIDARSNELDLRPAIREQWLLSVPGFVLCRDDCRGLCASCGADLNAGDCGCPPVTTRDSRWDALRAAVELGPSANAPASAEPHAPAPASARRRTGGSGRRH